MTFREEIREYYINLPYTLDLILSNIKASFLINDVIAYTIVVDDTEYNRYKEFLKVIQI